MDVFLARVGILPVYIAACVCLSAGGRDLSAGDGVLRVAGIALFILALRAVALSYGKYPGGWPAPVVWTGRVVLAGLAAFVTYVLMPEVTDQAWLIGLATGTAAAAMAAVVRPFPDWLGTGD